MVTLFSANELRRWLQHAGYADLLTELPGEKAPLAELVDGALGALERRGHIDADLFERLQAERPRKKGEIARVAEAWQVGVEPAVEAQSRAMVREPSDVAARLDQPLLDGAWAAHTASRQERAIWVAGMQLDENVPSTPPAAFLPRLELFRIRADALLRDSGTSGTAIAPFWPEAHFAWATECVLWVEATTPVDTIEIVGVRRSGEPVGPLGVLAHHESSMSLRWPSEQDPRPILDALKRHGHSTIKCDSWDLSAETHRLDDFLAPYGRLAPRWETRRRELLRDVHQELLPIEASTEEEVGPALQLLDNWASSDDQVALLLGEFGCGKSTILNEWALDRVRGSSLGLPIVVLLARVSPEKTAITAVLESASLAETAGERARLQLLIRYGRVIPCFDGFDEFATRTAPGQTQLRLHQFLALARRGGRVAIAARDHYFGGATELTKLIDGVGPLRVRRIRLHHFPAGRIDQFVHAVLGQKRAPGALRRINEIYDLGDLVRRPLLFSMTLRVLEYLDPQSAITCSSIYESYLKQWLDHDHSDDPQALTDPDKIALAEALALELWNSGQDTCGVGQLRRWGINELQEKLSAHDAPSHHKFLSALQAGCTFFVGVPERDDFSFAHKSFLEFFVARGALGRLPTEPGLVLGLRQLSSEILDFIREILMREFSTVHQSPSVIALQNWLSRRRTRDDVDTHSTQNAFFILAHLASLDSEFQWIPRGADLRGIRIRAGKFAGIRLSGVDLSHSDLSSSDLRDVDLRGASLRDADLSFAQLDRAILAEADAAGARMVGTEAHRCDLRRIDLRGADLRQSVWTECLWSEALVDSKAPSTALYFSSMIEAEELASHPITASRAARLLISGISWSPDERMIATVDMEGLIEVFDSRALRSLFRQSSRIIDNPNGYRFADYPAAELVWHPNSEWLAYAHRHFGSLMMSPQSAILVAEAQRRICGFRWSSDGALCAHWHYNGTVCISSQSIPVMIEELPPRLVRDLCFSPDGDVLVVASARVDDATATFVFVDPISQRSLTEAHWDVPGGCRVVSIQCFWHPDSGLRALICLSVQDRTPPHIREGWRLHEVVVDVQGLTQETRVVDLTVRSRMGLSVPVVFDAVGATIAAASADRDTWFVDVYNRSGSNRQFPISNNGAGFALSPSGEILTIYDRNRLVNHHFNPAWQTTAPVAEVDEIRTVISSPDEGLVAIRRRGDITILDLSDLQIKSSIPAVPSPGHWNADILWSPDGRHIVFATEPGRVCTVDTHDSNRLIQFPGSGFAWLPDRDKLALLVGHEIRVRDVVTGADRLLVRVDSLESRRYNQLNVDPGGVTFYLWGLSHALLRLGGPLSAPRTIPRLLEAGDTPLCRSADGRFVAVRVLRRLDGRPSVVILDTNVLDADIDDPIESEIDAVYGSAAAFSPQGRRLAVGTLDGRVRILQRIETAEEPEWREIHSFDTSTTSINSILWLSGDRLVVAEKNCQISLWALGEDTAERLGVVVVCGDEVAAWTSSGQIYLSNPDTRSICIAYAPNGSNYGTLLYPLAGLRYLSRPATDVAKILRAKDTNQK
jgi:uncharacterized protein YjbI with pentapeptide repeats